MAMLAQGLSSFEVPASDEGFIVVVVQQLDRTAVLLNPSLLGRVVRLVVVREESAFETAFRGLVQAQQHSPRIPEVRHCEQTRGDETCH